MEPSGSDREHGRFRNPWGPQSQPSGGTALIRWFLLRTVQQVTARDMRRPSRRQFAREFMPARPSFPTPRSTPDDITITWIGHSSFLVQIGGHNLLLDPIWSDRASPISWLGPRRWVPPAIAFDSLPPIDAVLVSHDHYDHLDRPTVRRIARHFPGVQWVVPRGVKQWFNREGISEISEFDWWDAQTLARGATERATQGVAPTVITATPAQHFSGRGVLGRDRTLWCGWAIRCGQRALFCVGDSGYHPAFSEIGARLGPFDAVLMPIGSYDPQWFMQPVHMSPEDAVRAFGDIEQGVATLAAKPAVDPGCIMAAMHWGTFRLTDEPMDEPPRRARAAWDAARRGASQLWIPRHGETRFL